MVFYAFVLVMKPRPRLPTSQALREIARHIYQHNGLIRSFKNEGILRPYHLFRDADQTAIPYARYMTLQVDMGEEQMHKVEKMMREHSDVQILLRLHNLERPVGLSMAGYDATDGRDTSTTAGLREERKYKVEGFPLDTFTRLEEEIHWPPQVSGDVYEQLDQNWKEFSRTRWSNYLRN
ncbi:hypothetical protein STCU_01500 [Strigomonas culicis]|uniref:Ribosomal protein S6 n=1 Tax=Strigomonas culicis TaxID=28005 RepID=S9UUL1_9TRYP|nr:hypothetical protein STCU_02812 [Strigomonas culicis]EPY34602.1 hypothetical protein STCU_01500 [Strigomonas culicis]|eukprot:EPY32436.1 hypothetical protein STCU_02812 [Strigomonas culicis]